MTLVAAWMERGTPILIGDVLTTSESNNPVHRVSVPTRDDLLEILPLSGGVAVEELYQKVYVISPSLCVGFCDSPFSASDVVATLSAHFGRSACTLQDIRRVLTSISDHSHPPCTIIGWVSEADGFHCFRWTSTDHRVLDSAEEFIIGSGRSHFARLHEHRQDILGQEPVESAIAMIGDLMKDEVLYASSLPHRFGGAYKVIAFQEGEFRVIPSILFVPFQIEETADPTELSALSPKRALKSFQHDEMLEVMAVHLSSKSVGTHERDATETSSHSMYYAPPIGSQPGDRYVVNSSLAWRSSYYCIAFDIRLRERTGIPGKENLIISLSRVLSQNSSDKFLSVEGSGADLDEFMIKDPLFKEIFKFLSKIDRDALIRHAQARYLG